MNSAVVNSVANSVVSFDSALIGLIVVSLANSNDHHNQLLVDDFIAKR